MKKHSDSWYKFQEYKAKKAAKQAQKAPVNHEYFKLRSLLMKEAFEKIKEAEAKQSKPNQTKEVYLVLRLL